MDYHAFRRLTAADEPVVWHMLMHAAHEQTVEAVRRQPELARYAAGWGRRGDAGVVAMSQGQAAGAAWLRLWVGSDKGFGYFDDATPELAMAVLPAYRGHGVGTRLLAMVLDESAGEYPAISLNVRATNPAVRLYRRAGFAKVDGSEIINRTGGVSFTMIITLPR
jgi:ribosomal protein S18 acetylase RimI-like enzyme